MKQKSMFMNTVYKSILSLFNIVVPLIIGPYITKLLDQNLYGMYNRVFSEFQIFLTLASFGIYTFGVREISKIRDNKEKVAKFFTNLCVISFISNFAVIVVYVIYALFTSSGLTTTVYLLMVIQLVGNIFYIEFVNEALENYKFITIKTALIKVLYLVAMLLFVKKPTDVIIYTIVISLTVFANNFVSFVYAKRFIKFDFKSLEYKKFIKPLLAILIITNVDMLYSQLDRVMLGKFVSDVAVSYYFIPYYIVSTLAAVPYSIIHISIPRLSYILSNEGKESYEQTLKKSISSLMFIILPMCMGLFVLADEVIFLYAGEKYAACVSVMMLSCITRMVISAESAMTHLVMYPNNSESSLLKMSFGCGVLNLILNSILVIAGIFTPFTAMLTTALAEGSFATLEYIFSRRRLKIKASLFTKQNLVYLVLALMFIPIKMLVSMIGLGFWIEILVTVVLCCLLYAGALLIMKDDNALMIKDKIFGIVKRRL